MIRDDLPDESHVGETFYRYVSGEPCITTDKVEMRRLAYPGNPFTGLSERDLWEINDALIIDGGWDRQIPRDLIWMAYYDATDWHGLILLWGNTSSAPYYPDV